jgi:hypothetical protein
VKQRDAGAGRSPLAWFFGFVQVPVGTGRRAVETTMYSVWFVTRPGRSPARIALEMTMPGCAGQDFVMVV